MTNYQPMRIKAYDMDGNSVTIQTPDGVEISYEKRHLAAARALCHKMNWQGRLAGGGIKNGMAFVFLS